MADFLFGAHKVVIEHTPMHQVWVTIEHQIFIAAMK
jgi:hypothetical protein